MRTLSVCCYRGAKCQSVIAALSGTPELEQIRQDYATTFTEKCRALFTPFCNGNTLQTPALWAMLGAAEGLSWAVVIGKISAQQAKDELVQAIVTMVRGSQAMTNTVKTLPLVFIQKW